jgi:hypothetical protein
MIKSKLFGYGALCGALLTLGVLALVRLFLGVQLWARATGGPAAVWFGAALGCFVYAAVLYVAARDLWVAVGARLTQLEEEARRAAAWPAPGPKP